MPLAELQNALEGHFSSLARQREGTGFPLFVFEHGLDSNTVEELSDALRGHVQDEEMRSRYWLLWAVYATEHGYAYEGDEYWGSFENETPGWTFDDRGTILRYFRAFQERYNGVIPTGPWAEHFRLIAWPITHAILPRYLQIHFARALFDLRFELLRTSRLAAEDIGRLLAGNVHSNSTRFMQFLQQEELCGRIVLGLFGRELPAGHEPIYPPTLRRIVADLERVQRAGKWLREARHVVADTFKGVGRGLRPAHRSTRPDGPSSARAKGPPVNIRPRLTLRRNSDATWSVAVQIPGLGDLSGQSTHLRQFIGNTRCKISGAEDWKPRGWASSATRQAVIRAWPDPNKPLLIFEQDDPVVQKLLNADYRMTDGPIWVFKIGRDGAAREILQKLIRPGNEYILVAVHGNELPTEEGTPCTLDCAGVTGLYLSVPDSCTTTYQEKMEHLGLEVARTIRVWPAGLPARGWDGEGTSEWLTTERPCFGIVNDHPISAFRVSLNEESPTEIPASTTGDPVFLSLPPLEEGIHYVTIEVERTNTSIAPDNVEPPEGQLALMVREPKTWRPGATSQNALIVTTDPYDAYLEKLWEEDVKVSVLGPSSHQVTCDLEFEDPGGEITHVEHVLEAQDLPLSGNDWQDAFHRVVERPRCAWAYLESTAATIRIDAEELGEYTLRFERTPRPVRWILSRRDGRVFIRLVDETGDDDGNASGEIFDMERPLYRQPLATEDLRVGMYVESPGSLYVARQANHTDAVIVSAGLAAEGLQGLNVSPNLKDIDDLTVSPAGACKFLTYWTNARLAGFLAEIRRNAVVDAVERAIWRSLCGTKWMRQEDTYLKRRNDPRAIRALQNRVGGRTRRFVEAIQAVEWHRVSTQADAAHHFALLAMQYRVTTDFNSAKFALTLAAHPPNAYERYHENFQQHIDRLREDPRLLRAARLLRITTRC